MANEKRLIDATELIDEINEAISNIAFTSPYQNDIATMISGMERVLDIVEDAQTVDAVEVVHGHDTGRCRIFHCSECGYGVNDIYQEDEHNYPVGEFNCCPNCGAKMDGGADE